jgi:hypothetical protein
LRLKPASHPLNWNAGPRIVGGCVDHGLQECFAHLRMTIEFHQILESKESRLAGILKNAHPDFLP